MNWYKKANYRLSELIHWAKEYFGTTNSEYFGTTNSFAEAGYILPDGEMLDLSGKNQGKEPEQRSLDHREISYIEIGYKQKDLDISIFDFMYYTGAIRFGYYGNVVDINIVRKIAPSQKQKIIEIGRKTPNFNIEVSSKDGNRIWFDFIAEMPTIQQVIQKIEEANKNAI